MTVTSGVYDTAFADLARHDRDKVLTSTVRGVLHAGVFHYRRSCTALAPHSQATDVPATAACALVCARCTANPHRILTALRRAGQIWNITEHDPGRLDPGILAEHEHAITVRRTHLDVVDATPGTSAFTVYLDQRCEYALTRTAARITDPEHHRLLRRLVNKTVTGRTRDESGPCTFAVRADQETMPLRGDPAHRSIIRTIIRTWLTATVNGPGGTWQWGTAPANAAAILDDNLYPSYRAYTPDALTTEQAEIAFGLWDPSDTALREFWQAAEAAKDLASTGR